MASDKINTISFYLSIPINESLKLLMVELNCNLGIEKIIQEP